MRLFIMSYVNHDCASGHVCVQHSSHHTESCIAAQLGFVFPPRQWYRCAILLLHNTLFSTSKSLAVEGGRDKTLPSSK